ncbi:TMhelix containing protein [Vibrio phage 1.132.O._10N.222.49.F8]|nr:TMhelix containing protein [Vibrio phage 1.132.O._10N.222.49.F8]
MKSNRYDKQAQEDDLISRIEAQYARDKVYLFAGCCLFFLLVVLMGLV